MIVTQYSKNLHIKSTINYAYIQNSASHNFNIQLPLESHIQNTRVGSCWFPLYSHFALFDIYKRIHFDPTLIFKINNNHKHLILVSILGCENFALQQPLSKFKIKKILIHVCEKPCKNRRFYHETTCIKSNESTDES